MNIKLIDFLKTLDSFEEVRIWYDEIDNTEPEFEGFCTDVPWIMVNRYIVEGGVHTYYNEERKERFISINTFQ